MSIPLADFFDDGSFHYGGNGVFDPVSTARGGNGELISIVLSVISNSGADATFRTDYWAFTTGSLDADGDRVPDAVDNCPADANADQADGDGDGVGDACEEEAGVLQHGSSCEDEPESWLCAPDSDEDGWADPLDVCPEVGNSEQADGDGDGAGDACDPTPEGEPPAFADPPAYADPPAPIEGAKMIGGCRATPFGGGLGVLLLALLAGLRRRKA